MNGLPHITNYQILSERKTSKLGSKIETAIHNGWQPFGPLTVVSNEGETSGKTAIYSQALVKHAEWCR